MIQPILYQRLIDKFCSEYDNLEELENESAFGAWKNNQFYFAHENYLMVFRDLKILNESIIFEAIDFARFNDIKYIKDSYKELKAKLGSLKGGGFFEE